jgi:hypothetical protein
MLQEQSFYFMNMRDREKILNIRLPTFFRLKSTTLAVLALMQSPEKRGEKNPCGRDLTQTDMKDEFFFIIPENLDTTGMQNWKIGKMH